MNANLVAFDPDAHLTVTPEILHYRHKISPYMGQRLRGVVRGTWLRGEKVFTRSDDRRCVRGHTPRPRGHAILFSLTSEN